MAAQPVAPATVPHQPPVELVRKSSDEELVRKSSGGELVRKSSGGSIRPELLRGVKLWRLLLHPWLWHKSPVDLAPAARHRLHEYSDKCRKLDIFISHAWRSPGWQKCIAILTHLCAGHPAVVFALLLGMAALLAVLGRMPTSACPCGLAALMAAALALPAGLAWPGPLTPSVFLDCFCINQVDEELKSEGVRSLSGFLANSKQLHVLWTPAYLQRAWCVYELAMFAVHQQHGTITVCPVPLHLMKLGVIVCVTFGLMTVDSPRLLGLLQVPEELTAAAVMTNVIVVLAPVLFMGREYLREKRVLCEQLSTFDFQKVECRCPLDRQLILQDIEEHYGSVQGFNAYVQTRLRGLFLASIFRLSYLEILALSFPLACRFIPRSNF